MFSQLWQKIQLAPFLFVALRAEVLRLFLAVAALFDLRARTWHVSHPAFRLDQLVITQKLQSVQE
jgi:hypothetical protein